MRRQMMVSLLVLMIAFSFNTTTFAQATPDASASPMERHVTVSERVERMGE